MPDHFVSLGFARLPWLEPSEVKARFLERSVPVHPDRLHTAAAGERQAAQDRFTRLNLAASCLADAATRLRHLLELERNHPPQDIQNLPGRLSEFLFETGRLCQKTDAFLRERGQSSSPMLQAGLFQEALDYTEKLQAEQRKLQSIQQQIELRLKALNPAWESAPPHGPDRQRALPLDELEALYREQAFVARWSAQVQERLVQLAFPP